MCTRESPLSCPGSTPPSFPTEVLHPASSHSLQCLAKVASEQEKARIQTDLRDIFRSRWADVSKAVSSVAVGWKRLELQ